MNVLKILLSVMTPIVTSALMYLMVTRTGFKRAGYWQKQIALGLIFSQVSALATYLGVNVNGMFFNVRDAAPICAGLIFGGPAGIIAGIIGGLARFLMIYWGQGLYTCAACTIACIFSGLFAAFCRHYLFGGRIPKWLSGLLVVLIVESVHMLLILLTHINDIEPAFAFVSACLLPIMISTGASVGLSLFAVESIQKKISSVRPVKTMSQAMMSWLAVAAAAGFMVTALITFTVETIVGYDDLEITMERALDTAKGRIGLHLISPDDPLPETIELGHQGGVFMLNNRGEVVAGPSENLGPDFSLPILLKAGEDTMIRIGDNSTGYYYMYARYADYDLVCAVPASEAMSGRNATIYLNILTELLLFLAMYMTVYVVTKHIMLRGLHSISDTLAEIPGSEKYMDHSSGDSFASLSDDILSTTGYLKDYVKETEGVREDFRRDARILEQIMVPSVFPPFPEAQEFDLYSQLLPGNEASGSFYNYFLLPDHQLCFLIGQTSGTGMAAALEAVNLKNRMHDFLRSGQSLLQVMKIMNRKVCESNRISYEASIWAGILNLSTGELEYINSGYCNPIASLKDKGVRISDIPSARLGEDKDSFFEIHRIQMYPGDRICLFSPGVFESENASGVAFGIDRLHKVLHAYRFGDSDSIVHNVLYELQTFIGSKKPEQDIAILELEVRSLMQEDRIELKPDNMAAERIMLFKEKQAQKLGLDELMESRLQTVIDSLLSFEVDRSGATMISLRIVRDQEGLLLEMEDNGTYDIQLQKEMFMKTKDSVNHSFGGLNLFLLRQYTRLHLEELPDGRRQTRAWISAQEASREPQS